MNRTYRDGWTEIFGDRDDTLRSSSNDEEFNYVEPPLIDPTEIDWKTTRALSIGQPWAELIMLGEAELIMLGEKEVEYRSRATNHRRCVAPDHSGIVFTTKVDGPIHTCLSIFRSPAHSRRLQ